MHRHDHHHHDRHGISAVIVTVSDTRTIADDESGALITELLRAAGHEVVRREIVKDDRAEIESAIRRGIAENVPAVILTGGTGIAPRDVTYEVVASVLQKTLDGFGEAFRRLSWEEVGAKSILSRAVAGSFERTLIVALPGSAKAVKLGMEKVLLPVLPHAVGLLRG
ncbi:MAG: MogA/MoaB family molybdenum cofactor biosynthesis protein [Polyangiales bacterium]